jgi:uncharacterized protein YneF (UPF0154 family)
MILSSIILFCSLVGGIYFFRKWMDARLKKGL